MLSTSAAQTSGCTNVRVSRASHKRTRTSMWTVQNDFENTIRYPTITTSRARMAKIATKTLIPHCELLADTLLRNARWLAVHTNDAQPSAYS